MIILLTFIIVTFFCDILYISPTGGSDTCSEITTPCTFTKALEIAESLSSSSTVSFSFIADGSYIANVKNSYVLPSKNVEFTTSKNVVITSIFESNTTALLTFENTLETIIFSGNLNFESFTQPLISVKDFGAVPEKTMEWTFENTKFTKFDRPIFRNNGTNNLKTLNFTNCLFQDIKNKFSKMEIQDLMLYVMQIHSLVSQEDVNLVFRGNVFEGIEGFKDITDIEFLGDQNSLEFVFEENIVKNNGDNGLSFTFKDFVDHNNNEIKVGITKNKFLENDFGVFSRCLLDLSFRHVGCSVRSQASNNLFQDNRAKSINVFNYYFSQMGKDPIVNHYYNQYIDNHNWYLTSNGMGLSFNGGDFENNALYDITLTNEEFIRNTVTLGNYGAALAVNLAAGGSFRLNDVIFVDNNIGGLNGCCGNGGAVSISNGDVAITNMFFNRVLFDGNSASSNAGAIYMYALNNGAEFDLQFSSTIFDSNYVAYTEEKSNYDSFGGAIFVDGMHVGNKVKLGFDYCLFRNNSALNGGVLAYNHNLFYSFNPLTISMRFNDTRFENNIAVFKGGAFYLNGNVDEVRFTNCSFDGNKVTNPEGIFNKDIDPSMFTSYGGCIYYNAEDLTVGETEDETKSECVMLACSFENNMADDVGGSIYFKNSKGVSVENSWFDHNEAVEGAGSVYIHQKDMAVIGLPSQMITIAKDVFIQYGNSNFGGGMILDIKDWESLDLNGQINYNEASIGGGGIYFVSKFLNNPSKFCAKDLNVTLNTAPVGNNVMTMPMKLFWNQANTGSCSQEVENGVTYQCTVSGIKFWDGYNLTLTQQTFQDYPINLRLYKFNNGEKVLPIEDMTCTMNDTSTISFSVDFKLVKTDKDSQLMTLGFFEIDEDCWNSQNVTFTFVDIPKQSSIPMYLWAIIIGVSLLLALCVIAIVVIILINEYFKEYSSSARKRRARKGYERLEKTVNSKFMRKI